MYVYYNMKFNKIGWLSIILRLFICLFLFRYIFTIKDLIQNSSSEFDDYFYFIIFLLVPLAFTSFLVYFYKFDFIFSYFACFVAQWIVYLNVNPYPIDMDNKFAIMEKFPEQYKPAPQFMLADIFFKPFEYPVVIKPTICSGGGADISIINSKEELDGFMQYKVDLNYYMVQKYLEDHTVEIGVLYEKFPWETNGRILEIAEKTNNDKIRAFVTAHLKKHTNLINNNKVLDIFHNLIKYVPNANAVRFDIRLKHITDLEKGDFKIVEMNGTMGMPYYKDFDVTWYFRRLIIGAANMVSLHGYSPLSLPAAMYKSFMSMHNCDDYENIWSLYS
jgi:D-ala D-ala ligase C-terminus